MSPSTRPEPAPTLPLTGNPGVLLSWIRPPSRPSRLTPWGQGPADIQMSYADEFLVVNNDDAVFDINHRPGERHRSH